MAPRQSPQRASAQVSDDPAEASATPRRHRGDIMSVERRSALMSRIRGKGTKPELAVAAMLDGLGIAYECHARDLPGRPDFVMRDARVVVLVDGDFWHGWRFSVWRDKLSPKWETKIEANRNRDARNMRKLRRLGWRVVRLWEHQIKKTPEQCLVRVSRVFCADADRSGRPAVASPGGEQSSPATGPV